jgi:hypothetical protein
MSASPTEPDHRERDDAIAVNSYTTVLGRRSLAEDDFRAYWRDVHGPLCSRVPGLGWYVQHHFSRTNDAHLWPAERTRGPLPGLRLDGAVEIGFASAADQATFQDAADVLFSDEQNVFEETAAYDLPDGSTTYVDRLWDPIPNGPDPTDRLHVHVGPATGREDELRAFVDNAFAPFAAGSPHVLKLRVHAPQPHDNEHPSPPAPGVAHTVPAERLQLVVLEIAFRDPLARRAFFAGEAFRATEQRWRELSDSITAFHVSGVHTFVRDGRLTTAGLRGSRPAELVAAVAAQNQTDERVRALFGARPD